MRGGYMKTKENFADTGHRNGILYVPDLIGPPPRNHRLVGMTTGEQVKLLHQNLA
jgi:hypothetical protein